MPVKIRLIGWLLLVLSIAYAATSTQGEVIQVTDNNSSKKTQSVRGNGVPASMIKNNAPKDYTVKKSDTVMKIAHMYLKKVGYWPQFVGVTSIGKTKIYPGDNLQILTIDGLKLLTVQHSSRSVVDKLEPEVRDLPNDELPPISIKKLKNLILHPMLIPENDFEALPMVVSGGAPGDITYTAGDTIYVKGLKDQQVGDQVSVFSKFRKIIDPDTKESLGFEVRYNGDATISQIGPVSSLELTNTVNYVSPLDRVINMPVQQIPDLTPHRSDLVITGKIVALYDAITSTAEDNTVIINRGSRDGVDSGMIFDITDTRKVIDPTSDMDHPKYLVMPPTVIGELLIYKVYDKMSFGLITDSARPVLINAIVQSQQ